MPSDADYMRIALDLAAEGLGEVWPNPAVGCVLVAGEGGTARIVGRGRTARGGRPHAETVALAEAGAAARGATVYVTLEPCAHHGRTGPCAEALAGAGVARVVSAMEDPDPRVSGRGHRILEKAGVRVDVGVGEGEAREINAGFVSRILRGRPFVQLKLAVSADWKIAARPGAPTAITGAEAGRAVHRMRAQSDAILVGQGTWSADDPLLTCRLPGLEDRSPVRLVLDARAELPLHSKLVRTARNVPVWAVVGTDADPARRAELGRSGVRVIEAGTANGRFDLPALLRQLGNEGVTRLFVEGGGRVAQSLVESGLVDELILIAAPGKLGATGVPAFGDLPAGAALSAFALARQVRLGADTLKVYRKADG